MIGEARYQSSYFQRKNLNSGKTKWSALNYLRCLKILRKWPRIESKWFFFSVHRDLSTWRWCKKKGKKTDLVSVNLYCLVSLSFLPHKNILSCFDLIESLRKNKSIHFVTQLKFHVRIAMQKKFIIIQWLGMLAVFSASIFEVALSSWVCFAANCFVWEILFHFVEGWRPCWNSRRCFGEQQLWEISFPTLRFYCIQTNIEIRNCFPIARKLQYCFRVFVLNAFAF